MIYDGMFLTAIRQVLDHEGGYVDDPDDPGGATNHGVSLRYLRSIGDVDGDGVLDGDFDLDGDVDPDDIRAMTRDDALRIYHDQWWVPLGYGAWPDLSIAGKAFDLAVNMGARPAHKCLQRAVRSESGTVLVEDGLIGPASLQAMRGRDPNALMAAFRSEAAGRYRVLIARRPKFAKYERGWLKRAYA